MNVTEAKRLAVGGLMKVHSETISVTSIEGDFGQITLTDVNGVLKQVEIGSETFNKDLKGLAQALTKLAGLILESGPKS
jgi:hypothetical protein